MEIDAKFKPGDQVDVLALKSERTNPGRVDCKTCSGTGGAEVPGWKEKALCPTCRGAKQVWGEATVERWWVVAYSGALEALRVEAENEVRYVVPGNRRSITSERREHIAVARNVFRLGDGQAECNRRNEKKDGKRATQVEA